MPTTLKELMMSLAGKPKPAPPQAVWLVNCPDKVGDDFAGAIAQAEYEFEDYFRFDKKGIFIGSTAYLANSARHLTPEKVAQDWEAICRMMDGKFV